MREEFTMADLHGHGMLRVPTGVVDFLRGEFQRKDGQVTRLTTKELEALAFLADRANSPVSREVTV
jgi:DNA-binding response OmpR family regulator